MRYSPQTCSSTRDLRPAAEAFAPLQISGSVWHPRKPMSEPILCRGWTAAKIREAVLLASDDQRDVLRKIAADAPISAAEVADALGRSYGSVRALLAAWSRRTATLGVRDPQTGEPSWPWSYERRRDGSTDYVLTPAVRDAILSVTGSS